MGSEGKKIESIGIKTAPVLLAQVMEAAQPSDSIIVIRIGDSGIDVQWTDLVSDEELALGLKLLDIHVTRRINEGLEPDG